MDEEFKNQDHIDDLRRRLYDRNFDAQKPVRHELHDEQVDVSRNWNTASAPVVTDDGMTLPLKQKPKRRYRQYIFFGSLLIFIVAAALSSAYLYFGGNQISGQNISLSISGPNTIGGGEKMSAQIGMTNQNAVALESVTLIVKYPSGTQTAEEPIQNLFEERIWLDTLTAGEVKNIPINAVIYGEEGDEKQIEATLEYRIEGSNGTFYKDAEPLTFQVVTSPIVVQVNSVNKVASGQEVEVEIEVKSNTTSPFNNLLITASYPNGFSYKSSTPEPTFGQNVWRIPELLPEETKVIKLTGTIRGLAEESLRLNVSAGPAQPDNQFIVGAILNESYTEFTIERPFLDVSVEVNKSTSNSVVLPAGEEAGIKIMVDNTLDESVYDMVVEVVPGGNVFQTGVVDADKGFFDSNTGVIRWESANQPNFAQVLPDESRTVEFSLTPGSSQSTGAFDMTINVYGRRVAERSAQEQLVGTVVVEARYSSNVSLENSLNAVSGPIPPKVGQTTSYAVALVATAGVNDVTNAIVRAQLPVHVVWKNDYATDGTVIYNSVSRELEWRAGNIDGGKQKDLVFTLDLLPSSSQVGTTPVLVERQIFEATDRFTNARLQADAPRISTEIENGSYAENNGRVEE